MTTIKDIVRDSLRMIGVYASGETPSAAEIQDGLTTFNDMLDSWSAEGLLIYTKSRETFSLLPSQSSYTMGPLGDFVTERPMTVDYVSTSINGAEYEIEILNSQAYDGIAIKSLTQELPTQVYIDDSYPKRKLYFYPVPLIARQIFITSTKPLLKFTSAASEFDLPPGYARALKTNLAIELCAEYGRSASQELAQSAMQSKTNLKRQNSKPCYMDSDAPMSLRTKRFDYRTGE